MQRDTTEMAKTNQNRPEGFDAFVEQQIQPLFEEFKLAQAVGYARLRKFGAIGAIIGAALGGWLYLQQPKIWPVCVILIIAFTVLGMIPGWLKLVEAKDSFGTEHVGRISKFLGLDHQAAGFEPPLFEQFNQLDLVPVGDRHSFSDLVCGTHDGTKFTIYAAHVEERRTRTSTDSKGNTTTETYWATIFNGQLLHSPYPRKFACTTILARDRGWFNTKGRFGKKMKPMGLADPKFEKLFEVYTTDQVEGRFLVDPTFMTRLLALEDSHKKRKTMTAFHQQSVLVALQGGTSFFGKLGKKSSAAGLAADTLHAFQIIFHFLEMLKGKKRS